MRLEGIWDRSMKSMEEKEKKVRPLYIRGLIEDKENKERLRKNR